MPKPEAVYRQRNPQPTPYYRCVEDHLETLEQVHEDRYERTCGFFRPHVKQVMERYLDCGNLLNGFARIKCEECGHEYLLAFSCKRRHFCPSCHQKRVVEFGEWLCQKENQDDLIPCVLEPNENSRPNRNRAGLIQKIYEVDPLTCPKCQGIMRVISIIEDQEVIDKILKHLGMDQKNQRPPPRPKSLELHIDYSDSRISDYQEAFSGPDVFPDYLIG